MPKQRYKSETLANKLVSNLDIFDDVHCNTIDGCCGFNVIYEFLERSTIAGLVQNYDEDVFDGCYIQDYEDFQKQYNETKVLGMIEEILYKKLCDYIAAIAGNYPFIVTLLEKQQEIWCTMFDKYAAEHNEISVFKHVISGSTKNLLSIYVYTPTT